MPSSLFSLGHLLLAMQTIVKCRCETPLGENKFSFANDYQLEMTSELGLWICVHFFQLRAPTTWVLTHAGSVHAALVSVRSYMCLSC